MPRWGRLIRDAALVCVCVLERPERETRYVVNTKHRRVAEKHLRICCFFAFLPRVLFDGVGLGLGLLSHTLLLLRNRPSTSLAYRPPRRRTRVVITRLSSRGSEGGRLSADAWPEITRPVATPTSRSLSESSSVALRTRVRRLRLFDMRTVGVLVRKKEGASQIPSRRNVKMGAARSEFETRFSLLPRHAKMLCFGAVKRMRAILAWSGYYLLDVEHAKCIADAGYATTLTTRENRLSKSI